MGFVGFF